MNIRLFSAAATLVLLTGVGEARAQITTVIGPPKRAQVSTQDSARRDVAVQDSIARITMTDMKQWVDSAAQALALRPDTGTTPPETTSVASPPRQNLERPDSATRARQRETAPPEFREGGSRAPDTATSIPTLALIGGALVVLGLAVGRRRRSPDSTQTQ